MTPVFKIIHQTTNIFLSVFAIFHRPNTFLLAILEKQPLASKEEQPTYIVNVAMSYPFCPVVWEELFVPAS